MRYDAKKLADLHAECEKTRKELLEVSDSLNQQHEIDGSFSDDQVKKYSVDQGRHAQLSRELESYRNEIRTMEMLEPAASKLASKSAFSRFVRSGSAELDDDERKLHIGEIRDGALPGGGGETFIIRGATRSDDVTGQELLEEDVRPSVIDRLAFYGGVSRVAQHFMTGAGNDYRLPQNDDSTAEGELLANQGVNVSQQDLANFGVVSFGAYTASSKTIGLTREMLQDSIIDIQAYAERKAVRRLGRLWDRLFTNGTGVNQPDGVVPTAKVGTVAAAANTLTWKETVALPYKIDRAYRMGDEMGEGGLVQGAGGGQIGYLISDDAERILAQMTDADNRPLWRPSTREGNPNMLNGYPYVVSGQMDTVATGNVPMLFGNFGYFGIRTINQIEMFRFMDSRTMQNNSVECLAFSRRDARVMGVLNDGKCEAYVKLTMA